MRTIQVKKCWYILLFLLLGLARLQGYGQNPDSRTPYPIIFVHGLTGDETTWRDDSYDIIDFLKDGNTPLREEQVLNITLDKIRSTTTLNNTKEEDVELFTKNPLSGDLYIINFNVHANGSIPKGCIGNVLLDAPIFATDDKIAVVDASIFQVGDIIRIQNEFMQVTGNSGSILTVKRNILGTEATFHFLPNVIYNLSNESNQAAIAKQGYGLKLAIDAVKEANPGVEKVVLVGHSMGGLAIREYIRSYYNHVPYNNSNDVAKVVTIGTPHYGSNLSDIPADFLSDTDSKSDAVRDLRSTISYKSEDVPGFVGASQWLSHLGIFLHGGPENILSGYYSKDVNCNGSETDIIKGINDFSLCPFPEEISKTWIVSDRFSPASNIAGLFGYSDGVVLSKSQFIYSGDTLMCYDPHNSAAKNIFGNILDIVEPKDIYSLIRGLDEPDEPELAYEIGENSINKGFITYGIYNNPVDVDQYKINLKEAGLLKINILASSFTGIRSIYLTDEKTDEIVQSISDISETIEYQVTEAGTYYIQIRGIATNNSFDYPYTLNTNFVATPSPILNPPASPAVLAGNGQVTLSWSAPSTGTPLSYNVYKGTSENSCTLYANVNSTTFNKTVTGLTNGTTYWFYATAVYSTDESTPSNKLSATPTAGTVYYPPRNLATSAGDGQVSLSWSGPSSGTPSSYNIYMGTSESGSYSFYASSASTNKIITGLTNGTTYWFYVSAVYPSDISGASNKISAVPSAPILTSNDDCSGARLLTSSTSINYLENQTVNNATASGKIKATCDKYAGTPALADVWYYFKATALTHIIYVDPNGSQLDAVISVYNSCSSNTELFCSDITGGNGALSYLSLSGLTIGSDYYIRVYDYGLQTTNGGFRICVTGENSNINNNCTITSISPSSITHSSSSFSTTPGADDIIVNAQPNCTFTVSESCTWLTVTPVSGYMNSNTTGTIGQAFLNYSIQENTSTSDRQCTFYINDSPVVITQKGIEAETGLPDLIISYNSHTPVIITPETLVHVNCTRQNMGTITVPAQKIGFYISSDDKFNSSTDQKLEEILKTSLSPGSSSTGNYSFEIPNCYKCGNYFIFIVIDSDNLINESDENNNYANFPIQITGCIACSYSIPPTGINFQSAGGSGNFNVTTTECCEWTASTTDNFITIQNSSGIGNGYVNYTIEPSSGGGSRTGAITVAGQKHIITQNCVESCNNSQTFEWAAKAGSTTLSDAANDLAIDASGNLYMTGDIQGAATFGGGITLTTPSTAPDVFVSKHNSSGQIQWAVRYGDTDQEYGTGIATDNSGNIYVIGTSANAVTFGSTILTANAINEGIAFIIKLNSSGILQWAKKINALNDGYPADIVVDKNDNIFVTGSLSDYSGGTGSGFFIAKYNTSGNQTWYKTYGFSSSIKNSYGIAVDNLGNLYMSGRYMETMTLGSNIFRNTTTFDIDGFISKLDANGNVIWANRITSPGQGDDVINSIAIDADNNIYAVGNIDSTAIIGNITIPLSNGNKMIIIKYDQNGNAIWAKAATEGFNSLTKIIKGNDDNMYFTGIYSNILKIDSNIIAGTGSNDCIVGCIDKSGLLKWIKGFGSSLLDVAYGIAANATNDIFIAGGFQGTVTFGSNILTSSGSTDIFLTKFKQCDPPNAKIIYSGSLAICTGVSKSFATEYCSSYKYQWARNNIDIEDATLPSYIATQAGSYCVKVSSFEGCATTSNAVILSTNTVDPPVISQNGKLLLSTAGSSYQWNLNGNPITGATNQFYEPLVPGKYTVSVTNSTGCSAISDITVIKENQAITFDILPSKTICDSKFDLTASSNSDLPITYTSSNTDVATISGNKVTILGTGTTDITASQTGDVKYNAATPVKQTLTVTNSITPIPEISVNGSKTICLGNTVALTSSSANSYLWSNGATTQSITVSEPGDYSVTVNKDSGCEKTSEVSAILLIPLPKAAEIISGNSMVTKTQTNVLYSVPEIDDASLYIWTLPNGATGTSTTNSILVSFGNDAVSGDIKVKGHNDCGDGLESVLNISVVSTLNQDISLNTGWNIISANVIPSNLDLKTIFQPLIDAGKLKKVMDETGKTIENFGSFGGWKNNIGDLNSSKGYKVSVTAPSTLSLEGMPVGLPMDMALNTGWNIISYPTSTLQDAKEVVQVLIDAGKLKKVMDETGRTIENFGSFGGWKNSIGNFTPGKGYKVSVTENCILNIPATMLKTAVIVPEVLASTHFTRVFSGNGTDHMNIYLVNLQTSGLLPGDEIGVFDGTLCVGSVQIGIGQLAEGSVNIPASGDDGLSQTVNGFRHGNPIALQLFREGQTYSLNMEKVGGNELFEMNASLFAKVSTSNLTVLKMTDDAVLFKCYPNPFTREITIEVQNFTQTEITVEIYNMAGQRINRLFKGNNQEHLLLKWNGTNDSGQQVAPGVYLCKVNGMVKQVIFEGGKGEK